MNLPDAPAWAVELLEGARVGRLAFLDESDSPRVLPVTFALLEGVAWSAIDRKPKRRREPARVERVRRSPAASLCADRYSDDWTRLAWVEARGAIEVHPIGNRPEALAALTEKYEQYLKEPPPGPLLGLRIERIGCWRAAG